MVPDEVAEGLRDEAVPGCYAEAAQFFSKALQVGGTDPEIAYLLALAYKRQGKTAEARAALRKIARPDAAVWLQMGLLSLREKNLSQAEGEFARAFDADPSSYPACYNLLLTRLTLGQLDACRALLPRALELAPSADEKHYLALVQTLLADERANGDATTAPLSPLGTGGEGEVARLQAARGALADLSPDEEARLLQLLRGLGQLDVSHDLLARLAAARPDSAPAQKAYAEVVLIKAKMLADRGDWLEAERLLQPLTRVSGLTRQHQIVLYNLIGCLSCLNQDFEGGVRHFTQALKLSPTDARLCQNLALAYELAGQPAQADPLWNRYFDLLTAGAELPRPSGQPDYYERLAFEGLMRLAARHSERERWAQALGYMQRAQRLRPRDPDTLERLFHLYNHLKRTDDARKTLRQLREVRPNDPQYELYELDLLELRGLGDIERLLGDIDRVLKRHPNDARVEERAGAMIDNVVGHLRERYDWLAEELGKVVDQVRRLPNYQINWPAVGEVVRDLQRDFQKLRKITNRCLPLAGREVPRRRLRDLVDLIDRKIDVCRSILR